MKFLTENTIGVTNNRRNKASKRRLGSLFKGVLIVHREIFELDMQFKEVNKLKSMHLDKYFLTLLTGIGLFIFIFSAEFLHNTPIISQYSLTATFVFLLVLLLILIPFTIRYVKVFHKGQALLILLIVFGGLYLFFLFINVIVMF